MQVVKRAYQQFLRNNFVCEIKTYNACCGDIELTKRKNLHYNATASTPTTSATATIIIIDTTTKSKRTVII